MPTLEARVSERRRALLESEDPVMLRLIEVARRAAPSQSHLLVTGESGTGKSLLARFIHESGSRASGPFVEIPCANIPEELIESELFGHEKGAFTGATAARVGRFEQAAGGTVLIDGVGELSPGLQAKLLRVLQERAVERLGGNRTIEIDTRFIASAQGDIDERVASGTFRSDLFYRLNVVRLDIPPLRERGNDARLLAERFLADLRVPGAPARISAEALEALAAHSWPGNVRELRNAIESAALACDTGTIELAHLPLSPTRTVDGFAGYAAKQGFTLARLEEAYIREVLRLTRGNKSEAARILGIHRKTLLEKRRRYGIE